MLALEDAELAGVGRVIHRVVTGDHHRESETDTGDRERDTGVEARECQRGDPQQCEHEGTAE